MRTTAPLRSLISADTAAAVPDAKAAAAAAANESAPVISHWCRNLTINLIADQSMLVPNQIMPSLHSGALICVAVARARWLPGRLTARDRAAYHFDPITGDYYPPLWFNDFWVLQEHLEPINESDAQLPLHMWFASIPLWKWQMMLEIDRSLTMQTSMMAMGDAEKDSIKQMLLETNPYLLVLTMIVSVLHMVFDFLAFKNGASPLAALARGERARRRVLQALTRPSDADITFWRKRESLDGLSLRTILLNVFLQTVVLLYLFDSAASWLIVGSSFIGVLIEAWKIHKAARLHVDWVNRVAGVVPRVTLRSRFVYRTRTRQYDDTAFRYLMYIMLPIVVCYSIYSLIYETHKSWYSWILSSLVSAVYMFGFIMMTPQLFINYKLKSVAHLPWRMLAYKALNTFIDDLFAFIIKMPTLHRLACFRDGALSAQYGHAASRCAADASVAQMWSFASSSFSAGSTRWIRAVQTSMRRARTRVRIRVWRINRTSHPLRRVRCMRRPIRLASMRDDPSLLGGRAAADARAARAATVAMAAAASASVACRLRSGARCGGGSRRRIGHVQVGGRIVVLDEGGDRRCRHARHCRADDARPWSGAWLCSLAIIARRRRPERRQRVGGRRGAVLDTSSSSSGGSGGSGSHHCCRPSLLLL